MSSIRHTMISRLFLKSLLVAMCGCLLTAGKASAQAALKSFAIIPYPTSLKPQNGEFTVNDNTVIVTRDQGRFRNEVMQLQSLFTKAFGRRLKQSNVKTQRPSVIINLDAAVTAAEGYRLSITPAQLILSAGSPAGMFRAVETIRQLMPAGIEDGLHFRDIKLPACLINDQPAYSWRGMHLDVSRHFFSVAYLKKFIDVMSLYKMNKLHLHLTDDQGWRIEIKKYPKLTEEGAWRTFDKNDSACIKKAKDNPDFALDPQHIIYRNGKTLYGGFYTQQQMRDLVRYALNRHIDIIPEIDMPGHMMAAITAYPFLTCNGENKFGELFSKPICPCNESTFEFAENVFTEIMDIFPSQYIHIGGDEVDRSDWAKSAACKALMEKEGIKDLPALQSYFINRMEKFFNSKGRKLIGWDEVIEGGISPTAIVMYWRGWVPAAPVKAVRNGNKVIMTPGEPLYFDNLPDQYSIFKVYHFNPVPAALNAVEAKNIIGAQANLWSENIPSENRADYMYMPRMTALAELLWTNDTAGYASYLQRLHIHFKRLDAMKVHYRLPDLPGIITENVFTSSDTLAIRKPLSEMRLFYTTDGTLPSTSANELVKPLIINASATIKLAAFTPNGLRGDIYTLHYKKENYADAVQPAHVSDGLLCNYYKAYFKRTGLIGGARADSSFISSAIAVPVSVKAPSFAITYHGYIEVPADGVYSFYLTCDDGGVLKIAGGTTVDNDGLHSAIEKNGQVALRKGLQPFDLAFIEGGGGFTLKLKYSINGSVPKEIPASWFKH